MADFDWNGTCAAAKAGGPDALQVVAAGQVSDGVCFASYPLADDGNYKFWVFSDPYKATISKDVIGAGGKVTDTVDVEEDVTETWNLACLVGGYKDDPLFKTQGVRLNGSKYSLLRELGKQTYTAKIEDATHAVTMESVFLLKGKEGGLVVGVKGGYYFAGQYKSDPRSDPYLAVADALAIGFYWAVGPDA